MIGHTGEGSHPAGGGPHVMERGATVGRPVWRSGSRKNAVCVYVGGQSALFREAMRAKTTF